MAVVVVVAVVAVVAVVVVVVVVGVVVTADTDPVVPGEPIFEIAEPGRIFHHELGPQRIGHEQEGMREGDSVLDLRGGCSNQSRDLQQAAALVVAGVVVVEWQGSCSDGGGSSRHIKHTLNVSQSCVDNRSNQYRIHVENMSNLRQIHVKSGVAVAAVVVVVVVAVAAGSAPSQANAASSTTSSPRELLDCKSFSLMLVWNTRKDPYNLDLNSSARLAKLSC